MGREEGERGEREEDEKEEVEREEGRRGGARFEEGCMRSRRVHEKCYFSICYSSAHCSFSALPEAHELPKAAEGASHSIIPCCVK